MKIYGDYNSSKARLLTVRLIRCQDDIKCKSDEEITNFLSNKYFLILANERRFDSSIYGQNSIYDESSVVWLPINT